MINFPASVAGSGLTIETLEQGFVLVSLLLTLKPRDSRCRKKFISHLPKCHQSRKKTLALGKFRIGFGVLLVSDFQEKCLTRFTKAAFAVIKLARRVY